MSTCIVIFTTVVPLYYSITVNNCTLLVSFGDFCLYFRFHLINPKNPTASSLPSNWFPPQSPTFLLCDGPNTCESRAR